MPTLLLSALLACTGQSLECSESSMIAVYADEDRDGFGDSSQQKLVCEIGAREATVPGDCDDTRSNVNPVGVEECDGLDNDCDNEIDDNLRELTYYADADADGFGDESDTVEACTPPPGYVENPWDCHDDDPLSYPEADEFCDGKDNNCDDLADDDDPLVDMNTMPTWYFDGDGDGYGDPDLFLQACEAPFPNVVPNGDDCDDADPNRHPGVGEVCNMVDDDCDGHLDDSDADLDPASLSTFYYDGDGDGFGDPGVTVSACDAPWFYVTNDDDCDDAEPMLQDASTGYWVLDSDGDGFGAMGAPATGPQCTAPSGNHVLQFYATDCDDTNALNFPDGDEVCDGADNDCDNLVDDADDSVDLTTGDTYFVDTDGDGFGDPDTTVESCSVPAGATTDDTDCDDARDTVNPGATEVCNGSIDDDCDGLKDEADPSLDLSSILTWYYDFDGDGWGDPDTAPLSSCSQPTDYVSNDLDCNDNDATSGAMINWLRDQDADGFGAGAPQGPSCDPPQPTGWVPEANGLDCADTDGSRYPGAEDICDDGIDQDCDGADDPCPSLVPDTCAEAELEPPFTTGTHILTGDLAGFADDISWTTGNACTTKATAGGEAILPVTLQAGEALYASYLNTVDASIYLVSSCTSPTPGSCTIGGDNLDTASSLENLWYYNSAPAPVDLYVVLDCVTTCGSFDLELTIETPADDFQPDTCTDAQAADPMITGGYSIYGKNTAALVDDVMLAFGNPCTGDTTTGKDAFVPIELLAGETVSVNYVNPSEDTSAYLLRDCASVNSCVDGSDAIGIGLMESMSYTNATGATETIYLGIDCWNSTCTSGNYEIYVAID